MKNSEILSRLKVGDIVTSRQILATLKKMKLIYGYSEFGYLDSCWVGFRYVDGGYFRDLYETFPKRNAPQHTNSVIFPTRERFREFVGGGNIIYQGCEFRTRHLSGCFSPYLQLVSKKGDRNMETYPSMSLWGAIL